MTHLKYIAAFHLAILSLGSVYAYPAGGYPDRIVLAQHRVVARDSYAGQQQARPRRFATQPNWTADQRGAGPNYNAPPTNYQKAPRMSPDQRSALRRQINEANQGVYSGNRSRTVVQP